MNGAAPDWRAFYDGHDARLVSLPTYSFQRAWYWTEHHQQQEQYLVDSWRYRMEWKPLPPRATAALGGTSLVAFPARLRDDSHGCVP